ncbi:MAG: hypothetical protein E8D40_13885 [Nitrospira sp.]|nr:MAG: hypothetical protein E8D40_13885 [Nitrospira sp.]
MDIGQGIKSTFIANQVIFASPDKTALKYFLKRTGGTVIEDDTVPPPPAELGIQVNPDDLKPTAYVVQVDPNKFSLDDFAANANKAGVGGAFKISSEAAAKLMALSAAERATGHAVVLNYMSFLQQEVLNATRECARTATNGCINDDAFNIAQFQRTGSRSNVLAAWQIIAASHIQRRVWVAILDGGFYVDPITGGAINLPGLGTDFPIQPLQYDFVVGDYSVGAPSPTLCSGGGACPWHGTGSASVATGLVNNSAGAAGTGGLIADPMLFHLALKRSQQVKAIRTAILWGADVISMSYSGSCKEACQDEEEDSGYPKAISDALGAGIVLVASAGNAGMNVDAANIHPCTIDGVICVGALQDGGNTAFDTRAVDSTGRPQGWASNVGAGVDIWAPTNIPAIGQIGPMDANFAR